MLKDGETIIRRCIRQRGDTHTTIHDFAMPSCIFKEDKPLPPHIKKLMAYLRWAFYNGNPDREKSSSEGELIEGLSSILHESILPQMTCDSLAQGQTIHLEEDYLCKMGNSQHPLVQWHCLENDPFTIALEVPIFNDDMNGFIDILRLHEDWIIEVADFKPDTPKRLVLSREEGKKTKKQQQIESQVWRYAKWLVRILKIDPKFVIATYFDKNGCYRIIN